MGDIKQYRKKPVEIDAWQWTEQTEAFAITVWFGNFDCTYDPDVSGASGPDGEDWGSLQVETPNGWVEVAPFDYIIRGVADELYPCAPGIFTQTYDEVRK